MFRGLEGCLGGKAPQTICLQGYAAGRGRKSAKHPPVVSPDPILQCPWRSRSLRCILSYPAFRIQAPVSECAMLNRADAFTPKADCLPVALQTSGNHHLPIDARQTKIRLLSTRNSTAGSPVNMVDQKSPSLFAHVGDRSSRQLTV